MDGGEKRFRSRTSGTQHIARNSPTATSASATSCHSAATIDRLLHQTMRQISIPTIKQFRNIPRTIEVQRELDEIAGQSERVCGKSRSHIWPTAVDNILYPFPKLIYFLIFFYNANVSFLFSTFYTCSDWKSMYVRRKIRIVICKPWAWHEYP